MIPRTKPLKRSAPIARKRAKKRTWKTARCQIRGCNKKAEVEWENHTKEVAWQKMCHSHARIEALARWSYAIRSRDNFECQMAEFHARHNVRCAGVVVAGHCFGKGAYPSVMFELWNGVAKCSGLNAWVEDHTLEWDDQLKEMWGDDYAPRRKMALTVRKYDLSVVLSTLAGVKA